MTQTLSMAIADYDRVAALASGEVSVEGVAFELHHLSPSETFYRMLKEDAFDISEMSLSSFLIARQQGREWTAIPVFPYRTAFHVGILVNQAAGIKTPADLAGKRFGLTEYQVTAALWTRGVLQHDFGVDLRSIEWFVERGKALSHGGETGFKPPTGIRISELAPEDTLGELLIEGRLDAVLPSPYPGMASRLNRTDALNLRQAKGIHRLFSDPLQETQRYFAEHGFLHFNHTVVIHNRVLRTHPDLPRQLYDAFSEAKAHAYAGLQRLGKSSLVEGALYLERQREVYGDDPFPYGLAKNTQALLGLASYSAEQGLISEVPDVGELFSDSTAQT